jgi:hypothetical protein
MGCKTLHFFSPVQTGLPRELAKSLTRATQPGLVSPGGGEQAQRHHPSSLSSESGKVLSPCRMLLRQGCVGKQTVAWWSPSAGAALDPPLSSLSGTILNRGDDGADGGPGKEAGDCQWFS